MKISRQHAVYSMDKNNVPVARVALPARLTFETLDCFGGQVKCERDTVETLDFMRVNPATGPVYLEGVKAGDVIAVHICDIKVKSPGVMVAAPGAGVLGGMVTESQTLLVPLENGVTRFKDLEIPLNPMIGVIGVAPAGEPVPCGTPDRHGGNMDTTLIAAGSTLYLPVQVDGALLAMGDLHAAMGDGEIMVSGVEVAGEVDVTVELAAGKKLNNPLVVTENVVATLASAGSLDEAVETAVKEMAELLQQEAGLSLNEAGMLMSACGNAEISQVVDPLKTARFTMPRRIMKKLGVTYAF
ncbi:acetamidase/formamidase family protein [Desulforamulus putei]|uniref:Amidase n=1 Tax=Desulforamulus putei DSM 12395 TaxID=1121429 RepID=A0A1M4XKM4_9FIRM|nr:acetamidase/formamidase family protein [Desulforamulus putei]SHE94039.1 amidase [Desulforamulus putei DSM 12395]